jgi:hypothetical protein
MKSEWFPTGFGMIAGVEASVESRRPRFDGERMKMAIGAETLATIRLSNNAAHDDRQQQGSRKEQL